MFFLAYRVAQLVALICALTFSVAAFAEKRVALVIGNSSYVNIPRLANPVSDARLMADTLKALGFALVGNGPQLDLDKAGFDRVVQAFGAQLQGADVGLFYYAGHGVQVRGANYLVPVGANPVKEADVDFQMLDTKLVLRQMEGAGTRLNVVVLDACRNNPFGGRGLRSTGSGLAQITALEGTLISFATQPDNVALDGEGGNSPYTRALAQTLRRPGLDIFQTFNEVGLAVKRATGNVQQPWVSSSPIAGTFYFAGAPAATPPAPTGPAPDETTWNFVKDTKDPDQLRRFIEQFPASARRSEAAARLLALEQAKVAAVAPPTQPTMPSAPAAALPTQADLAKARQIFANSCAACHRSSDGLAKNYTAQSLSGFLREHYTNPGDVAHLAALLLAAMPQVAAVAPPVAPATPPAAVPQPAAGVFPAARAAKPLAPGEEAAIKPKDSFKECDTCPEMIVVPAGSFTMGSPESEGWVHKEERPQRRVTFARQFAVGRFSVTFDEWDACVRDQGCSGYSPPDEGWGRGSRPVINVSWNDAKAYVEWLSRRTGKTYRLLSEAEREYVTRAGTTTRFWWGNSLTTSQANYNGQLIREIPGSKGEARMKTMPVRSFQPNPWGLYQVHGNVWEWVEDCWNENHIERPVDGSAWTTGACDRRVRRGGSWQDNDTYLRSAARGFHDPYFVSRQSRYGFRVARTLTP